ncbi:unconventional myosin-XVIIIb-like isoform X2 [Scyliorhinus canicula]|uniref:unconventional myosin-XVIIIb-like isoform X2 n=1 Tax=Scyliorhinus canicula TaxID=7830 RepID=UPI0018F561D1|nr:unconventional myosin-XVIIIb-like isoform X2 [Scyliorhinus canicula]
MAVSSRLALWEQKIKEEELPRPPVSPVSPVATAGFIKQLVRETEKEAKEAREQEKERKFEQQRPAKLDDSVVQYFLHLTQNECQPVDEAMDRGTQLLVNGHLGDGPDGRSAPPPETKATHKRAKPLRKPKGTQARTASAGQCTTQLENTDTPQQNTEQNIGSFPSSQGPVAMETTLGTQQPSRKDELSMENWDFPLDMGNVRQDGQEPSCPAPERQEGENIAERTGGNLISQEANQEVVGSHGEQVDLEKVNGDIWYETDQVWYVNKEGFTLATVLKPDVGTPELPEGQVRIRIESDNMIIDTDEELIHKTNPPKLDYAEDLAQLISLNESSVLHVLQQRYGSQLIHTKAGPNLIIIRPSSTVSNYSGKLFKGKQDGMPPHVFAVAQRAYWNMLIHRKDQSIIPLGWSGAGKTTSCQSALEYIVGTAGSVGTTVTVEKIQAMFTILRAFGTISTPQNNATTRFSMVASLDFNQAGRVSAAHLQTMLLEQIHVAQQSSCEGTFNVFHQMLAGLGLSFRSELHLHQMAESQIFGILPLAKVEEKQRASSAFGKLQAAMETLGFTADEQMTIWRVLAAIYHLGAAGVCKVGRRQFMKFEWAQNAASVLGCELEELSTAVFKHHLKLIIQQATSKIHSEETADSTTGPRLTGLECVEGMAAGLYEELFAIIIMLINRSVSSQQLALTSIMVVDTPGFQNPHHENRERAATFEELCHNYVHERLQLLYHERTLVSQLERFKEEKVQVTFDMAESVPASTVSVIDQTSSQFKVQPSNKGEEPKGLLWILDEEVLVQGSNDAVVLNRLCSYFEKKGMGNEEKQPVRRCEQEQQFVIAHQLGTNPVRYDLTGWINKAKQNMSRENASQLLQESRIEFLKKLFSSRSKIPMICRSVSGLEGTSQQALHRISCVRKTFSTSFAAVKRNSVCALIKLQVDVLTNLMKRSEAHFVHCFVARSEVRDTEGRMNQKVEDGAEAQHSKEQLPATFDTPTLKTQLQGSQLMDALRLYRLGFPDHMVHGEFRRRFQVLAPAILKKYGAAFMVTDEKKATEELLSLLNLEKHSFTMGQSRVFFKAGVVPRLEKQREKLIGRNLILLQAACQGFLGRQQFKKMKTWRLALCCIQKNIRSYWKIHQWQWWQLMSSIRPMLNINLVDETLRAKEEEVCELRKKLEKSHRERNEVRETADLLEGKISDLTAELTDERFKGDVACRVLQSERAERLKLAQELKDVQTKYEKVVTNLNSVEKRLEEAHQQLQMRELGTAVTEEEWKIRYDCTLLEMEFLRKRVRTFEERIDSELQIRKDLEQKLTDLQASYEIAKRNVQQLRRKSKCLTSELEDTKVLMESQQSRNHELEKKQKRFDMELAQALGEAAFEKTLREKVTQENQMLRTELYRTQQNLQGKELEVTTLNQKAAELKLELGDLASREPQGQETVAQIKKQLRHLEATTKQQSKENSEQAGTIEKLEQTHLRSEIELERMKDIHLKELEDKEEELDDVRKSCQRRLRQLEMQLEQEFEERQLVLHERQDLESLVGTLCEQIGHRDFDVEKRLRRDLRRKNALLADAQLMLGAMQDSAQTGSKQEVEKLQMQLEESKAQCAEMEKVSKSTMMELENLHVQLENTQRNKNTADEQLNELEHEKADLLKRLEEDQEDLNGLMKKHKDLIAQSSNDIAQIQELQRQLEEATKEKQSFEEKLQIAQKRIDYMEHSMVERGIVSRQEAIICDLENKLEFQRAQLKRFETLVLRLRDNVMKMGEDLEQAAETEARETETAKRFQQRVEEMKVEMDELVEREQEASRRCMELTSQVESLMTIKQTLQADLETSIKRIADLQTVLEEESTDESDDETESSDSQSSMGSLRSVDLSVGTRSRLGLSADRSPTLGGSVAGSLSRASAAGSVSPHCSRFSRDGVDHNISRPGSSVSMRSFRSREIGKIHEQTAVDRPAALARRRSSPEEERSPSSSVALSEFVEELRRKRAGERELNGLQMDDSSSLPIYQTAGISSLRKRPAIRDDDDDSLLGFETQSLSEARGFPASHRGGAGLVRSASLRSLPISGEVPESFATTKRNRCVSFETLVEPCDCSGATLPKPNLPVRKTDEAIPSRPKPQRKWLELSIEEDIDEVLGSQPIVFKSKRFGGLPNEDTEGEISTWKLPSLSYERKKDDDGDSDILPAIRRSPSANTSTQGRQRDPSPLTADIANSASLTPLKKIMAVRPCMSKGDEEALANMSDSSSSSGSTISYKSADSIKNRPGIRRSTGERSFAGVTENEDLNTEREKRPKEESAAVNINTVMMKYLAKPDKE